MPCTNRNHNNDSNDVTMVTMITIITITIPLNDSDDNDNDNDNNDNDNDNNDNISSSCWASMCRTSLVSSQQPAEQQKAVMAVPQGAASQAPMELHQRQQ